MEFKWWISFEKITATPPHSVCQAVIKIDPTKRWICLFFTYEFIVCLFVCLRFGRYCEIRKRFYSNLRAYAVAKWQRCGEKNCSSTKMRFLFLVWRHAVRYKSSFAKCHHQNLISPIGRFLFSRILFTSLFLWIINLSSHISLSLFFYTIHYIWFVLCTEK